MTNSRTEVYSDVISFLDIETVYVRLKATAIISVHGHVGLKLSYPFK